MYSNLYIHILPKHNQLTFQTAAVCKMTNAICESRNESWVTIEKCRLRAVSRTKTPLTIEIMVLYPAYEIHVNAQLLKKANGYKPWLVNYTADACAFMRRANHPFIKIIYDLIKEYSTINHTCPYVARQMLKDFIVDPAKLMLPLPSGEYLLLLTWMFNKKPQFVTNVYFTFRD
ncbi:uncharacterized protein [Drosophila virilis]|uniref:Uncharacterized protein n=1 Tax=Drosophila virilis TaxID=7244 RepID=B4LN79_DROVI|nr:uncharacterized protein Dvir_GJ21063 [Drosophila virilis]